MCYKTVSVIQKKKYKISSVSHSVSQIIYTVCCNSNRTEHVLLRVLTVIEILHWLLPPPRYIECSTGDLAGRAWCYIYLSAYFWSAAPITLQSRVLLAMYTGSTRTVPLPKLPGALYSRGSCLYEQEVLVLPRHPVPTIPRVLYWWLYSPVSWLYKQAVLVLPPTQYPQYL